MIFTDCPLTAREPQAGTNYSPSIAGDLPLLRLTVEILSGQNIPRPNNSQKGDAIDPYVVVTIRGHEEDRRENQRYSTRPVSNNGFSPVWREKMDFRLKAPELAFIEFKVRQSRTEIYDFFKNIL